MKVITTAVATLLATSTLASADLIDFTDASAFGASITVVDANTLSGTAVGANWTGISAPEALNFATGGAPGPIGALAGDYDGLGINTSATVLDDEISFDTQSFTMMFDSIVQLSGLYFLDHFAPEEVHVSIDGGANQLFLSTADVTVDPFGYTEFTGLGLVGTSFIFSVGEPNEVGEPDFALAAVNVSSVPLPAGVLLLGGGLLGLGFMRRRQSA